MNNRRCPAHTSGKEANQVKKWFLTLMCMLAASVVMVGCSANTMSTAPTASP